MTIHELTIPLLRFLQTPEWLLRAKRLQACGPIRGGGAARLGKADTELATYHVTAFVGLAELKVRQT
ncbi:hypothetical protein [Rhizobium sp. L43]|uniref:hypothetical protein n=1 Tax=Rhizobium sp. L43 TaxID=2035452 RepID=UPI00117A8475|nr:hypothetical protein [Rhizobium sp. L43]